MVAVLGHWQFGGILTLQSGRPFSITSSNNAVAGARMAYCLATGDLSLPGRRSGGQEIAEYFNVTALGRFQKRTAISGETLYAGRLQPGCVAIAQRAAEVPRYGAAPVRAECFNALNHPQLGVPNGKVGNGTFGQITGTDGAPRIVRLGVSAAALRYRYSHLPTGRDDPRNQARRDQSARAHRQLVFSGRISGLDTTGFPAAPVGGSPFKYRSMSCAKASTVGYRPPAGYEARALRSYPDP